MEFDLSKMSQQMSKPPSLNIKKYLNYVLKKKYWIITIAIVFSIIVGIIAPYHIEMNKEYTTSSVVRFDDPRFSSGISAVTDFSAGMETASKVSILNTNSFLEQVVDSLNLNFIITTPKVHRTKLFKKINIDKNPVYGKYKLIQSNNDTVDYILRFEDFLTEKQETIRTFKTSTDSFSYFYDNGLRFILNNSNLDRLDEVQFNLIPSLAAAASLRENVLSFGLDRTRTLLTINYTHKDPEFSTYVTNSIADLFIKKLLDFKRFQTKSILKSLEEQLRVAQSELEQSENALREFRSENPRVFITDARQSVIDNIVNSQTRVENYQSQMNRLTQIQSNFSNPQAGESDHYTYQEAVAFLEKLGVPGADLLSEQYQQLLTEYQRLINEGYNENHPLVNNTISQIDALKDEIKSKINQHKNQLSASLSQTQRNIRSEERTLRNLPGNELKLAELMRNRQIKENILSSIMVRYNEAKVTDAATIPDAYIIDYAQTPIIRGKGLVWKLQYWVLGGIAGLFIGVVVFVAFALLDNKLWTSKEVEEKLSLKVLAIIPMIHNQKSIEDFIDNETIDPKLITSDYAPTPAGESFRRLRTILYLGEEDKKSIIISSLFPNEGKSLVSANLAVAFAQQKKKTLLVDGDLRRGVLHSTFARQKVPGLSDMLIKKADFDPQLISQFIQETHIPNLFLLTAGSPLPNPSEILGTNYMEQLFRNLESKFDRVVIDTPPFGLSPDIFVINSYVHNIGLVMRSEKTSLSEFSKALKDFDKINKDINGIIINGSSEVSKRKYYDYSYYSY